MIDRRQLLGASAMAMTAPRAAAQQPRVYRIGYLSVQSRNGTSGGFFLVFKNRLAELGYAEGRNVEIHSRWADAQYDRLPALATELVALKPDVIVAATTLAVKAVQQATGTIPIVMSPSTDPVGSGFIKSLARPGGNITGVANMYIDTSAKLLELITTAVPKAKRVGVLTMPKNPTHATQYQAVQEAGAKLGRSTPAFPATSGEEIDTAYAALVKARCDALIVLAEGLFTAQRDRLAALATQHRMPAIYQSSYNVDAGGLMSYGANNSEFFRLAAVYVDKILKGAKPADLPVEQPTRFELVVNLKTAKALGLSMPQTILLRADRVIE